MSRTYMPYGLTCSRSDTLLAINALVLAVRRALLMRLLARSVVLRERLRKDALSATATGALGRTTLRGLALRLLRRLVALRRGGVDALLLVRVATVLGAFIATAAGSTRRCSSVTVRRLLLILLALRRPRVLLLAAVALVPGLK